MTKTNVLPMTLRAQLLITAIWMCCQRRMLPKLRVTAQEVQNYLSHLALVVMVAVVLAVVEEEVVEAGAAAAAAAVAEK